MIHNISRFIAALALLATTAQGAWAEWTGFGFKSNPYIISTPEDLLLLAHRVNGTNGETANDYQGRYFKLGADITFSHADNEGVVYDENYEAIGCRVGGTDRFFKGDFDGDGHTVSGIRIRKTSGSNNEVLYQGLFGYIGSGANIHDVQLTDARITAYDKVGGIAGYNYDGYIVRCSVTDSYITANGNMYYGTICGSTSPSDRLTNNYYHGCTVNGTAVTSGKGCNRADITANNGALPAYRLDLGDGVTIQTTMAADLGFSCDADNDGTAEDYWRSGAVLTLTTSAVCPQPGYQYGYTASAGTLSGTTLTMPDQDVTVNVDTETLRSDGQQHDVSYTEADGSTQTAKAVALDGHEAVDEDGDVRLAGTYYVGTDIAYANRIWPAGDVTLILVDGKTMTLASNKTGIYGGYNITIYGQSLDAATAGTLRYDGTSDGITADNYVQHSGNVSITTTGSSVFGIDAKVTLRGGALTISANGDDARAIFGYTHSILGGQLTATATGSNATGIRASDDDGTVLTLGWTRPADFITVSSIRTDDDGGTVAVKDGQALCYADGDNKVVLSGTLTSEQITALAGKTLQPCLALADAASNTTAIADLAGQTLAVALSGRTLYKDGAWNTLCLPFDVTIANSPLAGDGVDVRTLSSTAFTGGKLTLNFTQAGAVTTLEAGKPYLVSWTKPDNYVAYDGTNAAECSDLVNPIFNGVTVSTATANVETDCVDFIGILSPTVLYEDGAEKTNLYMGSANKLYYPTVEGFKLNACRGYFKLKGVVVNGNGNDNGNENAIRSFDINFGDDATGIVEMRDEKGEMRNGNGYEDGGWYTVDGRRLDGKPARPGVYINSGRQVVIK